MQKGTLKKQQQRTGKKGTLSYSFVHTRGRFFSARREFADFWAVEQGTTHKNWSPSTSVRNACFKKSKWYKYLYFQFHVSQFFIKPEHILDILRAKKFNWPFTLFCPFFTARLTSESYNYPLKVLTEGSMLEYLPVGSQDAPQTIFGQKKFPAPKS